MLLSADLDRAQGFLDRALTLDPNHAWAWTRRGFLNVYRGDARSGHRLLRAGRCGSRRSIPSASTPPSAWASPISLSAGRRGRAVDAAGDAREGRHDAGPIATSRRSSPRPGKIDEAARGARHASRRRGRIVTIAKVRDALASSSPACSPAISRDCASPACPSSKRQSPLVAGGFAASDADLCCKSRKSAAVRLS